MERTIKTKFYHITQNNSGGYFIKDDEYGVCEDMVVEAQTAEEAQLRLNKVGENVNGFHDFCHCCGERWSDWMDDDDGTDEPTIYGDLVSTTKVDMFRDRCFVHYYDGSFKEFKYKE